MKATAIYVAVLGFMIGTLLSWNVQYKRATGYGLDTIKQMKQICEKDLPRSKKCVIYYRPPSEE